MRIDGHGEGSVWRVHRLLRDLLVLSFIAIRQLNIFVTVGKCASVSKLANTVCMLDRNLTLLEVLALDCLVARLCLGSVLLWLVKLIYVDGEWL